MRDKILWVLLGWCTIASSASVFMIAHKHSALPEARKAEKRVIDKSTLDAMMAQVPPNQRGAFLEDFKSRGFTIINPDGAQVSQSTVPAHIQMTNTDKWFKEVYPNSKMSAEKLVESLNTAFMKDNLPDNIRTLAMSMILGNAIDVTWTTLVRAQKESLDVSKSIYKELLALKDSHNDLVDQHNKLAQLLQSQADIEASRLEQEADMQRTQNLLQAYQILGQGFAAPAMPAVSPAATTIYNRIGNTIYGTNGTNCSYVGNSWYCR